MKLRAGRTAVGRWVCVLVGVASGLTGHPARGGVEPTSLGLFSISKSENRNQVAYALHLDASCRPSGEAPVFAYWRMLERSSSAVEPLLAVEQGAYGIGHQEIVSRGESGGVVRLSLRALPGRDIVVRSARQGGACRASASTRIGAAAARLFDVHARLRWPFGVSSIEVTGWAEDDGRVVRETLHP